MKTITLGDKVKDRVTGFVGIAVARSEWLTGCDRIIVQPVGLDKEGKQFEPDSFDEPMVDIVKSGAVKTTRTTKGTTPAKTGGPGDRMQLKASMKR